MAGKTLDLSILVRLVDRITGPLSALQRKFAGLAQLGQRIGVLGGAVAAISFALPLQSAAAFDQQIRDSVVTMGLWGQAAEDRIKALGLSYEDLALKVGIASSDLAKAGGFLVASGLDDDLTAKLMPTIGRVAKAASAATEDVAGVAFSLSDKFKISAADMELALAKLVTAGKLGRFEFKDMARELPELTSQFQKFGVTGMEAVEAIGASLQVSMFGTSDTRAAANNFKNFLSKILSPEAIKNFEKFGIGITGVMQDAAIKGINPIEAAIEKVSKVTGMSAKEMQKVFDTHKAEGMTDGQAIEAVKAQIAKIGGAAKLTQIFGDMQVLDFLLPMLQNIDKYKDFKKEIAAAGLDVIAKDLDTQLAGLQTKIDLLTEASTQFLRRIGNAFKSNVPWLLDAVLGLMNWMREIDQTSPGTIDKVLSLVGAFLALTVALGLLGPIFSIISAGLGVLALLFTPVGAAIAAIAALALILWDNWAQVGPMFGRMWAGIKAVFLGFLEWVAGIFTLDSQRAADGVRAMFAGLGEFVGGLWELHKASWAGFITWIDGWVGGALSGAIERVKAAWQGLIDWFKSHVPSLPSIELPAWARNLVGGGDGAGPAASRGASGSWGDGNFAPASGGGTTKVGGEIIVRAEQGTQARVQSDSPNVPLVQDRGAVLGRP